MFGAVAYAQLKKNEKVCFSSPSAESGIFGNVVSDLPIKIAPENAVFPNLVTRLAKTTDSSFSQSTPKKRRSDWVPS